MIGFFNCLYRAEFVPHLHAQEMLSVWKRVLRRGISVNGVVMIVSVLRTMSKEFSI